MVRVWAGANRTITSFFLLGQADGGCGGNSVTCLHRWECLVERRDGLRLERCVFHGLDDLFVGQMDLFRTRHDSDTFILSLNRPQTFSILTAR